MYLLIVRDGNKYFNMYLLIKIQVIFHLEIQKDVLHKLILMHFSHLVGSI